MIVKRSSSERLFIAIEFSEHLIDELVTIQQKLQKLQLFEGKFVVSEQLHLTLKFIGEIDEQRKRMVQQALRSIHYPSFEGCLGALGVLPNEKYIRIVWIDFIADALNTLVQSIEDVLRPIIQLEERPFLSHITLARVKRVYDKNALVQNLSGMQIPKVCCKVSEFVLKKSELTDKGSIYYDVERYFLV